MAEPSSAQSQIADDGTPAGVTARHPRLTKALQYLGAAIVFGTLAAVTARFGYNIWQRTVEIRARHATRGALVDVLRAASGPERVEEAVDPDGVVLRIKDGSWVAIRSVAGSPPQAVARDSGGSWFESDRPFGNLLAHYKVWQEPRARAKATNDPDWSEEGFLPLGMNRQLDAIEQSTDLPKARQRLRELGFEEFKP